MKDKTSTFFWSAVIASLAVKILLGWWVPITSDEAYFTLWARSLDFGYYDHPPMIGWLLWLVSFFGNAPLILRLPAIFSTILIGIGIQRLLRPYGQAKAAWLGAVFLASPINFLNVFITNDAPLAFFTFLSAFALYYALKKDNYACYFFSGVFLGLAFLSKYFAVFLGLAYAVYFFMPTKEKSKLPGFLLLFATAMPFAAVNVYWNYTHGWTNILFNLINRNQQESFSFGKFGAFLLSQVYLMTPPAVYYIFFRPRKLWAPLCDKKAALFSAAFLVPLAVFLTLSFKKLIGLHWVLAFYPFYYILLFFLLDERELRASLKFMVYFALLQLAIVSALLLVPTRYFKSNKNYFEIVLGTRPMEIMKSLEPYQADFALATPNYAHSALLGYHSGKYFSVFGGGSHHGRQDDLATDYSRLEGGNILILRTSNLSPGEYQGLFKSMEIKQLAVDEAVFYIVLGRGFNYTRYHDTVLTQIRDQYYAIPAYLPLAKGTFFYRERYFR
jgi:4-amino-4-deoxy-L-arabinose transferase-like glycosyltransferase